MPTKLIKPKPENALVKDEVIPHGISIFACGCRIEDERPLLERLRATWCCFMKIEAPEPVIERLFGFRCKNCASLGRVENKEMKSFHPKSHDPSAKPLTK
ncbi:hypothetical protein BOTNAR_0357g00010 [Botryotinia narcissicola]|uniref:Uncharacterized protein n=1 Tax=Botryotinia narcissicola TaxID=278944 RepID=A0A4Z1HRG5_9HELO|nr:hypothetical protein BOTNAR_0357g00010 [Botryotinia narcissicola]